ncbi:MAG: PDZ domain-containing protein [Planctomycetia bacterium]|nr:PDZ domain-containing protein [Planctomycetia bacterium]
MRLHTVFPRVLTGGVMLAGVCVGLPARADDTVAAPRDLTIVTGQVVGAEGAAGVPKQITIRVVGDAATVVADGGAAEKKKVPYLGVATSPLAPAVRAQTGLPDDVGLAVDAVTPGSPAAAAGLVAFDVLARYDDQILCAAVQLSALVKRTGTGNTATLTVLRGGKELTLPVTVGEREAEMTLSAAPGGFGFGSALVPGMGVWTPGQQLDRAALERLARQAAEQAGAAWQGQAQGVVPPAVIGPVPPGMVTPPPFPVPVPGNQRWLYDTPPGPGPQGPIIPQAPNPAAPGAVQSQSQSISVFTNQEGRVELREVNGKKSVSVFDAAGKEQYAGPYDTDADKANVPAALRERVEKAAAAAQGAPAPSRGKPAAKISL